MMNLPLKSSSFLLLIYLVACPISNADDLGDRVSRSSNQPSSFPTIVSFTEHPATLVDGPSTYPSAAPIATTIDSQSLPPSIRDSTSQDNICTNDPDWWLDYEYMVFWARETEELRCDDARVECCSKGNLGFAKDYCCKCSSLTNDCPAIPEDTKSFYSQVLTGLAFVSGILISLKAMRTMELRTTRQTMMARRQQQRENNDNQGLTEEERNNARYELFASGFHFQEVLPDKSNITVDGVRNNKSASLKQQDEENSHDEESKTEVADNDDDELVVPERSRHLGENPLRLPTSTWRKQPAVKDECCICLECYIPGETICAPVTERCDHVFHEGCIYEWFKRGNDKCPLCRIEFLKD
ncbi:unnamed protein product [Cylindrotheca closterium]|uniref:RING-type E3 ubiquitin transferase n=1 Tax=Cylindrotheca closterium TaxID=2856 RepID=A0AAD2G0P1_9STRA|nr:unnamed protein product [Cylindrotheca closterium]